MIVADRRPLIGMPAATLRDAQGNPLPAYRTSRSYPAALASAGAAPVAIPLDLPEDTLCAIFERLDGLCLTGGVDVDPAFYREARHPALGHVDAARDEIELTLTRWALAADLPVFGICRGIQLLNVAAGGSLYQDIGALVAGAGRHDFSSEPRERPTHRVQLAADSRLAALFGVPELMTNSFHHQAVKSPAAAFIPVAWADDGVIEGIEHPAKRFAIGVQWHPEEMVGTDPLARRLFQAFVAACR